MSVFSSLLVPLDGSELAARALGCAAWLSARLNARLHVVSATSRPLPAHKELIRLRIPDSCRSQLTLHHAACPAEEAILGVADTHDVGLIILSAHGEGAGRTSSVAAVPSSIGHVPRTVLERGNRPVLLLPDGYRERLPWAEILVPISAEAEVSPAASLALALANALVLCVRIAHVLDEPGGKTGLERAVRYADAPYYEYPQQLAEIVRRAVPNATLEQCRCIKGVALLRGDVSAQLVRQIESNPVSLIALGWHGSLLPGHAGVIKRLLAAITCPMLLAKAAPPRPFSLKVGPPAGTARREHP